MRTNQDLIKKYRNFENFLELFLNHFIKGGDFRVSFQTVVIDYKS